MTARLHWIEDLIEAAFKAASLLMWAPRSILLVLLTTTPVFAAPAGGYVTQLGQRVLALCDKVAIGEVSAVNPPFRGVTTARISIEEQLGGLDRPRKSVTLMYISDYLAPDAIRSTFEEGSVSFRPRRSDRLRRATSNLGDIDGEERVTGNTSESSSTKTKAPSTPGDKDGEQGVRLLKGDRGLFFLRRKGASYALIGFIPERDPLFARKRKRLEEVMAIEAIGSRASRIRAARTAYTKSLKATDVWERGNAAREIEAMARQFGGAFDADARHYLAERLYLEKNPTIAAALERAVRAVAPEEAFAYAVEAEERERKTYAKALAKEEKYLASNKVAELRAADLIRLANRYGRAATDILCRHLEDSDALIRESAAGALARNGGPSCRPRLRKALEAETERNAARAMVHTLGVKSDTESLKLIAKRLSDADLEQTAVQAIGRIGTDEAWRILRNHRDSASVPARALIDSILAEQAGLAKAMRIAMLLCALAASLTAEEDPDAKAPAPDTPQPTRRVSLADAIDLGLAYNLGIQSARFDALVARLQIARENAAWDWTLDSEVGVAQTLTPSRSDLAGAEVVDTDSANFVLGVSKSFREGPTLGIRWRNDRTFTNSSFATINPAYDTNLDISLTVPLLRGRGRQVQEAGLRASRAAADAARWELLDRAEMLIQEISNAYWNLVFLQERVRVQTKALEVAQDVEKTERRKLEPEIGRATVLSVAQAEAERLRREADLIGGQLDAENASDTLRLLVLPFTGEVDDDVRLDAKSRLRDVIPMAELGDLVERALSHRNDLRQVDSDIERLTEEVVRARNNLRIRLDLDAGVSWASVSGTPVDGVERLFEGAAPSARGAIILEWPIGRREAKAALRQAELNLERARVDRREKVNGVVGDVRLAHRSMRTSMREIAVRRKELAASLKALEGERLRLKRGSATVLDVALLEENAVNAALRLLQAQTVLERGRIDTLRSSGGLLERWNVRFDGDFRVVPRPAEAGAPKSQ